MAQVTINGKAYRLNATSIIGSGGEADVYDIGSGTALKLYKRPDDPTYAGNPDAQRGTKARILEHQHKLADFPPGLPAQVVAPVSLAYGTSGNKIVGYTMSMLSGVQPLLRYGDRQFRDQGGIGGNDVVQVFLKLHRLVGTLHQARVTIGDFNDLNVLVESGGDIHLVDADSLQYAHYLCQAFTGRFVDPLICGPGALVPVRPHTPDTDWYAYAVMLHNSMLYVGPYGGVHRPGSGLRLQHDARVLARIGVASPEVIYPKPALPRDALPDELLEHFNLVFDKDRRETFPDSLLQGLRWTACTQCGLSHARPRCPACVGHGVVRQTMVIHGTVAAREVFRTHGRILKVTAEGGTLRYLYHEAGVFRREGTREVLPGQLEPNVRYGIAGDATLIGRGHRVAVLHPIEEPQLMVVDTAGTTPMFDVAGGSWFWLQNGQLRRNARIGSDHIGTLLEGRTLFWTGPTFGLGFYRAGSLMRSFVFATDGRSINDQVDIPALPGELLDATCAAGDRYAWLFATVQDAGRLINHCYVVDAAGTVVAHDTASQDNDSWLAGPIHGRFAAGNSLFSATDEGIVRVTADPGAITVAQRFPDTKDFVDRSTRLLSGPGGIYAVSSTSIRLLTIT